MKYVIWGPTWKPANTLFKDFNDCKNVIRLVDFFDNRIVLRLFNAHLRGRLSNLPGKSIWPSFMSLPDLLKEEKVIFVYLGGNIVDCAMKCNLVAFLKEKYPKSKHVGYLLDVHNARRLDIKILKDTFDEAYIFDRTEAENMGIKHHPLSFSRGKYSDICYVGQDKGRLKEIVRIYDRLSQYGIKCFFYLCNVDEKDRIQRDGIFYGPMMDGEKSLQYIQNTKCVLELKVDDVSSYSDRVLKAVAYNKKILTNNPFVRNNEFYNDRMINIYKDVDDIDPEFIKDRELVSYGYTDEYSPIRFLERINIDLCVDNN